MSSRKGGRKGRKGGGGGNNDLQRREKLQAVVLADSFDTRFRPITIESPKVLMPLVNTPMIEYTLELLVSSGVEEIFVFVSSHADAVEAYLKKSDWRVRAPNVSLRCIPKEDCKSEGAALSYICEQTLIQSDFVLIRGDVVSNIDLKRLIAFHKARVKQNSNVVMTSAFKKAVRNHRSRPLCDDSLAVINEDTQELLYYSDNIDSGECEMAVSQLRKGSTVTVHYDIMPAYIHVCTPQVLSLFLDNWDYRDILHSFYSGMLGSEILGLKILSVVYRQEYAACVQNLRTYHAVSQDILQRWTHPLVPDYNIFNQSVYSFAPHNVYKEKGVQLALGSVLGADVAVGRGTQIGKGSVVKRCVIGRNCTIGAGVKICDSYLWDNCVVGDNAVIVGSLVASGVTVGADAVLPPGCILSYGVRIGAGHTVPPVGVSMVPPSACDSFDKAYKYALSHTECKDGTGHSVVVGTEGCGYGFLGLVQDYSDEEEGDSDDDLALDRAVSRQMRRSRRSKKSSRSGTDSEGSSESADATSDNQSSSSSSTSSSGDDSSSSDNSDSSAGDSGSEDNASGSERSSASDKSPSDAETEQADAPTTATATPTATTTSTSAGKSSPTSESKSRDVTTLYSYPNFEAPWEWWALGIGHVSRQRVRGGTVPKRELDGLFPPPRALQLGRGWQGHDPMVDVVGGADDEEEEEGLSVVDQLVQEIYETLLPCFADDQKVSKEDESGARDVQGKGLEIRTMKLSHHASIEDYSYAVFVHLLSLPIASLMPEALRATLYGQGQSGGDQDSDSGETLRVTKAILEKLGGTLEQWGPHVFSFKQTEEQLSVIEGLERVCLEYNVALFPLFPFVLNLMYEHELLSVDSILAWGDDRQARVGPELALVNLCQEFLTWLRSPSEDEEDDEVAGDEDSS